MVPERTHYSTLKVAVDAPAEVVRAAYRVLAQKYHPDRNPDDPVAAAEMALVNGAYQILSDADLRKQYDMWLKLQAHEAKPAEGQPAAPVRRPTATSAHTPQSPRTGQVSGEAFVDLERLWERCFGRPEANQPASEAPHETRKSQPAGAQGIHHGDAVDLNTVADGFAALFGRRRKK